MRQVDVAVVGAGPAGLSAAAEAASLGCEVALLDENAVAGGQLFKQIHKFFGSRAHRAGRRGSIAARLVSAMPVAVPTITLGFGYIIVFNTDYAPWLGTLPLLIAAHAIHTLPYLTNTLLTDLRHLALDRLEAAAATLGASAWQQFISIVVPNLQQSLISGLVMVAAISVGEFGLSNLLTSFQNRTYPVVLLQAFYGATGFACAATVILLLLACASAFISSVVIKKS